VIDLEKAVFPAGAGMNRDELDDLAVVERVPRRRGDEPQFVHVGRGRRECSPQARG